MIHITYTSILLAVQLYGQDRPRAPLLTKGPRRAGTRAQETCLVRGSSEPAGGAWKLAPVRAVVPFLAGWGELADLLPLRIGKILQDGRGRIPRQAKL